MGIKKKGRMDVLCSNKEDIKRMTGLFVFVYFNIGRNIPRAGKQNREIEAIIPMDPRQCHFACMGTRSRGLHLQRLSLSHGIAKYRRKYREIERAESVNFAMCLHAASPMSLGLATGKSLPQPLEY